MYNNPYFYTIPTSLPASKVGLFSRLFGNSGFSLGGILNGTQRALNFANQAIPFVKQVRPMIGNAKTMFKVMNEFKRSEKPKHTTQSINTNGLNENKNIVNTENNTTIQNISDIKNDNISNNDGPTFFI